MTLGYCGEMIRAATDFGELRSLDVAMREKLKIRRWGYQKDLDGDGYKRPSRLQEDDCLNICINLNFHGNSKFKMHRTFRFHLQSENKSFCIGEPFIF